MPDTRNHPVWSLYDEMRTARLNVECIDCELRQNRRLHIWIEGILAVSATSSIGGFWLFQTFFGGYIWKTVGSVAIVCTALKPILKLSDKLRRLQELLASYKILDHDLHCICIEVNHRQAYTDEMHKEFKKALNRKAELVKKSTGSTLSKRAQRACQDDVMREMPDDSFYIPE